MPENASFDERVKWHLEHKKNCSCEPVSGKVVRRDEKERYLTKR